MDKKLLNEVIEVIVNTVGGDIKRETMTEEFQLLGNILDSMAVTNLILALEDHFGFFFLDEELSAEAFETIKSLTLLVETKIIK
jgi:acyl carrier protein